MYIRKYSGSLLQVRKTSSINTKKILLGLTLIISCIGYFYFYDLTTEIHDQFDAPAIVIVFSSGNV